MTTVAVSRSIGSLKVASSTMVWDATCGRERTPDWGGIHCGRLALSSHDAHHR